MNWRFPFEFLIFFFWGPSLLDWVPDCPGKERERGLVTLKKIQLRQGPFSEYLIISSCNDDSRGSHFGSLFFFVFWWPIVTGKVTPLQQQQQQQQQPAIR
jgi:hypothetical protein